jgi:hypothetical protein
MDTDEHGFTEFVAVDMIYPESEPRKLCFHPCLSGLIRGSMRSTAGFRYGPPPFFVIRHFFRYPVGGFPKNSMMDKLCLYEML